MSDLDTGWVGGFVKPLRVRPGSKVTLRTDYDPGARSGVAGKKDGERMLRRGTRLLDEYQDRLAAQGTYAVLVILQAIDAGGKDSTIRHVMSGVNPQGVHVSSFKAPTAAELDHDYLWRHQRRLDIWKRRYREINDWERYLTDNGVRLVKLFLNVSKEEQRIRFLKRIDRPEKNWKFSAADARERLHWDDYQRAYSRMLTHTSTEWAPWYVLPADHKWFTRICAAAVIAQTLIDIDPRYPVPGAAARQELLRARAELEAEAPPGAAADPVQHSAARRGS
jgi:polyphosphate kinase 2 (PPK2 family)